MGGNVLIAILILELVLLALWALYLSFVSAGRVFLSFQWDTLFLEAGLLGSSWRRGRRGRASRRARSRHGSASGSCAGCSSG